MCGIYTFFSNKPFDLDNINKVKNGLKRRGPNSFGYQLELNNNLFLSHSRLSIQDLSSSASQPMSLKSGRFTILFNGEVYNHFELRNRFLSNIKFISNSDTETILYLIDKLGINKALSLLDGMVSIVIFSREHNKLFFYRDKSAQKPLFYAFSSNYRTFSISSNPSLFFKISNEFQKEYELSELISYFSSGFTNLPKTLYKRTYSTLPGYLYEYSLSEKTLKKIENIAELDEKVFSNKINLQDFNLEAYNSIFSAVIGSRPCGILLSGGIDSTAVAIACASQEKILRAYTLFSNNENIEEYQQALKTAKALGLDHISIELGMREAIEVAENLSEIIDYPNPDPSVISTYAVAKEASKKDIVLLTGDGGDEMFGGYNRYKTFLKRFGSFYKYLNPYIKCKILKRYMRNFFTGCSLKQIVNEDYLDFLSRKKNNILYDLCEIDKSIYMTQHTLPKTDRALMYFSLEGRAPLLNKYFLTMSNQFLSSNINNIEKTPLKKFIKNNIGSTYKLNSKIGFSAYLHKLAKDKYFLDLLQTKVDNLKDIFAEPEYKLNKDYFKKITSRKSNSLKNHDLRNLWLLYSFAICDENYS